MDKGIIIDFDDTLTIFEYWQRTKWLITNKWVENQLGIKNFDATFWTVYDRRSIYYFHKVRDTLRLLEYEDDAEVDTLEQIISSHYIKTNGDDIMFPDVKWFLESVKKLGFKLALLTMGNKDTHEPRLKSLELFDYFDVIKYGDLYKKPNKIPFLECIEELGTTDNWFVGDDQRDLLAPHFLGMKTIMLGMNKYLFTDKIKRVASYKELLNEIN